MNFIGSGGAKSELMIFEGGRTADKFGRGRINYARDGSILVWRPGAMKIMGPNHEGRFGDHDMGDGWLVVR